MLGTTIRSPPQWPKLNKDSKKPDGSSLNPEEAIRNPQGISRSNPMLWININLTTQGPILDKKSKNTDDSTVNSKESSGDTREQSNPGHSHLLTSTMSQIY